MILDVDCGNSRIKWRLRQDSGKVTRGAAASQLPWSQIFNAIGSDLELERVSQVRVVSVLGGLKDAELSQECRARFGVEAKFATSGVRAAGVTNGYRQPECLGHDRWVAMLAAFKEAQSACVIVDSGSALTVDVIDNHGQHLGGYIAPGLRLMRRALMVDTQKIIIKEEPEHWCTQAGRDTESAVTAAQCAMIAGLIQGAIAELAQGGERPILFVTGGSGAWLLPFFPGALSRPDLVLDGLALALT